MGAPPFLKTELFLYKATQPNKQTNLYDFEKEGGYPRALPGAETLYTATGNDPERPGAGKGQNHFGARKGRI